MSNTPASINQPITDKSFSIQKFNHDQFSELTTLTDPAGKIWFVGNEVAAKMGYADPKSAIRDNCKCPKLLKGEQAASLTVSPRGIRIIPESDLYRLVMKSKLSGAAAFQDWVCEDVLPAIRKNGRYDAPTQPMAKEEHLNLGYVALGHLKKQLSMSDISYLGCASKLHKSLGISTDMLPEYVENVRVTFSATDLLKKNKCGIGVRAFNKLMIEYGYLEIKTRTSTKHKDKIKKFNSLTDAGLVYGQNNSSPSNPNEVQPRYFEDTFMEIFRIVSVV